MDDLFNLAFDLHDLLIKTHEYLSLKEKEKIMESDEKLQVLFKDYKKAQDDYVNNKSENNLKTIKELKIKIETNSKVIEYNNAYNNYLKLLDKITSITFKDLISDEDDVLKKIKCRCK